MNSPSISPQGPTISSVEQEIESLLFRLSQSSTGTSPDEAKQLLLELKRYVAPSHLVPVVQLEEDGRKKRSTASASKWNFETGDIVIFYESPAPGSKPAPVVTLPKPDVKPLSGITSASRNQSVSEEVRQCCDILADAEKGEKQFVGYKWFRDLALPAFPYEWASTPEGRKRVLSEATTCGAILTKRIPNPKSPLHPTTAVSLNREVVPAKSASRFNPVPIKGEPISVTMLRDRGEY